MDDQMVQETRHGALTIVSIACNPFLTNSYVVYSDGEAVIVDASPVTPGEVDAMASCIEDRELEVVRALLTHAHIDHILGCDALSERLGVTWEIHPADLPLFDRAPDQAAMFGIPVRTDSRPLATLDESESVVVGKSILHVRHTPGHSPGSVSFVDEKNAVALVGDVLFRGSIGRTDLWQGSMPVLLSSIERVLMPLANDVAVFSGHGPATTIGVERRSNPFLQSVERENESR